MITVSNLTRRFGAIAAIEDISFGVRSGELFGLVGPDGAGKTTTLRILAGVLRLSAGEALVDGLSLRTHAEQIKPILAYMPQRFGLYAELTVQENLDFYADLFRVPRMERPARLTRLFEFSGLGPFRERRAGKLSGGMKQKLGLSCALIHQPRLLLLDEPTFGVDPISRRELWVIIHEMVAAGVTAVVSTSYLDEAERFDRVAMLNRGRVIALDTPDALRDRFGNELLEVRLAGAREAKGLFDSLPGVRRAVVFGDRLHVTVSSSEAAIPAIEAALRDRNLTAGSIVRVAPTLEDVFIEEVARAEAA
jgi:ABC-2 type transport system ATP-binding protein